MSCYVMAKGWYRVARHAMPDGMSWYFARMTWHGIVWHVTYYVTILYGIESYGMPWHRMHMKYFGHDIALPHMSRIEWHVTSCGIGIAWHCSLYCLHWCHQGLFIDRPVVVVGHVIHTLCNAEEHHSGAVSLRDRFTKVILKSSSKTWKLLVTVS